MLILWVITNQRYSLLVFSLNNDPNKMSSIPFKPSFYNKFDIFITNWISSIFVLYDFRLLFRTVFDFLHNLDLDLFLISIHIMDILEDLQIRRFDDSLRSLEYIFYRYKKILSYLYTKKIYKLFMIKIVFFIFYDKT